MFENAVNQQLLLQYSSIMKYSQYFKMCNLIRLNNVDYSQNLNTNCSSKLSKFNAMHTEQIAKLVNKVLLQNFDHNFFLYQRSFTTLSIQLKFFFVFFWGGGGRGGGEIIFVLSQNNEKCFKPFANSQGSKKKFCYCSDSQKNYFVTFLNFFYFLGLIFLTDPDSKHIKYKLRMGKDSVQLTYELKAQ